MDGAEQWEAGAEPADGEAVESAAAGVEEASGGEAGEAEPATEEPGLDDTAAPSGAEMEAALEPLRAAITSGFADVLRAFEDKIAYDHTKERQIDRLHAELQEHKRDLLAKIKRPLIQGIVRLHDDLGKVVAALDRRPAEELTPERFFRAFDGFADDIELLLGQHGIETYSTPSQEFDPRQQTALRTETTDDPQLVGTIAARLRPGFAEGETLLQKERVAVYAASRQPERREPPE